MMNRSRAGHGEMWQRDWRSSSNWHDARVEEDNRDRQPAESPAEQKEQQAASSHGEAAEPTDGQAVASLPEKAPESSAGSTSMVPIARQDKRAADVMESPRGRAGPHPSQRTPSSANGENGSFCNNC